MIRVAINGYGRIGRVAHRIIIEKFSSEIDVVAINAGSSTDIAGWMYLLKYDSAYGPLVNHSLDVILIRQLAEKDPMVNSKDSSSTSNVSQNDSSAAIGKLVIDGKEIPVFSQKDPLLLPWKELNVDIVIESTGHIRGHHHDNKAGIEDHLKAGAKAVVLSAPARSSQSSSGQAKGEDIPTYVLSVNSKDYKGEPIINNASCTTNCVAPVAKIMVDNFGVEKAMMTTIHGYTSDQRLQDGGHKDYRRARAAAHNIIPTSTGATIAAAQAVPQLQDKFEGLAIRVPVITGSLSDFTFLLSRDVTKEEVNNVLQKSSESTEYKGIVEVTIDPLVSSDIIGNPHSSIVDLSLTQVVGGNMVKIIAWYDNEYGYANRLVEEVVMVGKQSSNVKD